MFTRKLYAVSFTDVTNEKTLISRCHSPVDMIVATVNLNFQSFGKLYIYILLYRDYLSWATASTYLITLF